MTKKLLTREQFRNAVFERDKYICCIPSCKKDAVDPHHIIERSLFTANNEFGGYFLDNGASLCSYHHYITEKNMITPNYLRELCKCEIILPEGYEYDFNYNKWGEIVGLRENSITHPIIPTFNISHNEEQSECIFGEYALWYNIPLVFSEYIHGDIVRIEDKGITAEITAFGVKRENVMHLVNACKYGEFVGYEELVNLSKQLKLKLPVFFTEMIPGVTNDKKLPDIIFDFGFAGVRAGWDGITVRNKYSFFESQLQIMMAKYLDLNLDTSLYRH